MLKSWAGGAFATARWRVVDLYRNLYLSKPQPDPMRQAIVIGYGRSHGLGTLVETGTYRGDMVAACVSHFDRIVSIEIGEDLHRAALTRFISADNVELLLGDSAGRLPEVVAGLDAPAVFWLDGHSSGGDAARGDVATPILSELKIVLRSPYDHVVLIDDARLFGGVIGIGRLPEYPTVRHVRRLVHKYRADYRVEVKDDIIRLVPGKHGSDAAGAGLG
jgi:hypothetical protein